VDIFPTSPKHDDPYDLYLMEERRKREKVPQEIDEVKRS
jgi:hypothetical protein